MNIVEFRKNPIFTARIREIFSDGIFREALQSMQESNPAMDPGLDAPEVASVRMLSQMVGYQTYAANLEKLGLPMTEAQDIPTTFDPETN